MVRERYMLECLHARRHALGRPQLLRRLRQPDLRWRRVRALAVGKESSELVLPHAHERLRLRLRLRPRLRLRLRPVAPRAALPLHETHVGFVVNHWPLRPGEGLG